MSEIGFGEFQGLQELASLNQLWHLPFQQFDLILLSGYLGSLPHAHAHIVCSLPIPSLIPTLPTSPFSRVPLSSRPSSAQWLQLSF